MCPVPKPISSTWWKKAITPRCWLFSGKKDGKPVYLSVVAIYRFERDRIAEDWGIAAKAEWPMTSTATDY
jgi:hypothetical protein